MARNNAAPAVEEEDPSEAEPTLRETLEQAVEEVTGEEEAPPEGGEQPAREAQPRERGRFARRETEQAARETRPPARETEQPTRETIPAAGETPEQARQRAADEAAARAPGREPPPNADTTLAPRLWSQAAKGAWKDLPPLVRQEVVNREIAMHRELTRQDSERTLARQFTQTFGQYQDVMNSAGVHPVRFVEDVLKVMRTLQFGTPVQRAATLGDIARRNGIDPRLFAGVPPAGGQPAPPGASGAAPPQPRFELPSELTATVREWNEFKRNQAAAAARAQEEMAAQVMTEIQAFSGKPEHRFFEQVRERMETLLANGSSNTLEEAYNTAIYERPDIRSVLDQEAADKVRGEADRRLAAARARQRGVSIRGRGTGGATPKPAGERSLREELEAGFADARARV
jgi:hypothetical protein